MEAKYEAQLAPGNPQTELMPLAAWLREGLRASLFLRPRIGAAQPRAWQLLALLALLWVVEIALSRLEVNGPAEFDLRGWLAPWWLTGAALLMTWLALDTRAPRPAGQPAGLAAWFALWTVAVLPANLVSLALTAAQAHAEMPAWLQDSSWIAWLIFLGIACWMLGTGLRLASHFGARSGRVAALGAGYFAIFAVAVWLFPDRPWQADTSQAQEEAPAPLVLSQELFEAQQAAWRKAVDGLLVQRRDVADVYGLVFAPYAEEDVFLRESAMVAQLLAERFDAQGRVLQLVNHASTAETLPWATGLNLKRAIEEIALRMDTDNDVLVVYLTSHGGNNFRLAASHGPLQVDPLSPRELREALDLAGIRHRVIAISACYSGGWVGPLADEHTLVMTAADAHSTSFGCGTGSELTFFGRAVFDEQLRQTHSFERAFAAAVPLIRQREQQAGKQDGFSNPQISVGGKIKAVLDALAQRLSHPPVPTPR